MAKPPVVPETVQRFESARESIETDLVAVEEPLQIVLEHGELHARKEIALAITMRTPGHDLDLVRGFLYAEGVARDPGDIVSLRRCLRARTPHNVVRARLRPGVGLPPWLTERRLPMSSACGICGEATVQSLLGRGHRPVREPTHLLSVGAIERALDGLDRSQASFRHTGGTHGAGLYDLAGRLSLLREDVGRHNALDKLVGAWLERGGRAAEARFVIVSSRASFELVQKTICAGFPILVSVGAASSLAIDTARKFNLTLIGFARKGRFNVYSGRERIFTDTAAQHEVFVAVGA